MPTVPTIFALASAPGRAGVAVVRVSGPRSGAALQALCGSQPEARRASLRTLRHPAGNTIDRGLVLWMPGPASFTGEDAAELHVHGGPAVVHAVLSALGAIDGCRQAEAGEFARRAFANGRIDLTAAEGLADLIDAETEAQRRQALAQSNGALGRLYDGWRTQLIDALALMTAAIDFSDEADVAEDAAARARALAAPLRQEIEAHLGDGNRGEIVRDGFRVVLAGPPNAGKSSLLNALARRDAAIVSPEAGTTRDVIEVRLDLDGLAVIVADTAGLRPQEGAGNVEREGMRRTLTRANEAGLVVWLDDSRAPQSVPRELTAGDVPILRVRSKADLLGEPASATAAEPIEIAVSALTGAGITALQQRIVGVARRRLGEDANDTPVITRARYRRHLEEALSALITFGNADPGELELRAEDLRLAADALGRITGRVDVEDILDAVFSRFCIGK